MSTPLTNTNNSALGLLSNYRLRVRQDATGSYVDNYDMHLFLQKYVGLLGFTGQFAQTQIDYTNAGSQLLARWDNVVLPGGAIKLASFVNRFRIQVGIPYTTNDIGSFQFLLDVMLSTNVSGGVSFSLLNSTMSLLIGQSLGAPNASTYISNFSLTYYASDGHIELGVNWLATAGATKPALVSVYVDPPLASDGIVYDSTVSGSGPCSIPVLNTTNNQPITSSPDATAIVTLVDGSAQRFAYAISQGASSASGVTGILT